jgi:hypothetical protein
MASTSKYLQLNSQVLLEYIYQDPAAPTVIDTDTNGARCMILNNGYTGTKFLFTEDNPYEPTGNYRKYSAVPINSARSKYAYLTTNVPLNYLDYDNNLTDVSALLAQLTTPPNVPVEALQYDMIRLHLVSGYSIATQGDGFIFEVQLTDKAGKKQNLTSIAYLNSDNYEILNPDEFVMGEKLYTRYIELKIPAISYLNDVTISNPTVPTTLSYLMTYGKGVHPATMIDFSFKIITSTDTVNGYKFFNTGNDVKTSISRTDEYSGLSATIQESTAGDFFELYGSYNGDIYEDFIVTLDQQPNTKIAIFHDVRVIEQVGSDFLKTSEQNFIQTEDFGIPYKFRPIVLNSSIATSYRIEYTLRIFNTYDNSQIIRQAQFTSFDVKKYGRRIRKINLGLEPNIAKVYNVLPDNKPIVNLKTYNNMNLNQGSSTTVVQTEFVTSFIDRNRISASVSAVKIIPATKQPGDVIPTAKGSSTSFSDIPLKIQQISETDKVYQQGEAPIGISPFDNFYQFIIYNNAVSNASGVGEPQLVDLTQVGTVYINFFDKQTGLKIKLKSYTNIKDLNPANGEVVFKIPAEESSKILGMTDKTYYVSTVLETGGGTSEETLMYNGTWYSVEEKSGKVASDIIQDLQNSFDALSEASAAIINSRDAEISALKAEIDYQKQYVAGLEANVSELGGDLAAVQGSLSQAQDAIAQQQTAFEQAIAGVTNTSNKLIQDIISASSSQNSVSSSSSSSNNQIVKDDLSKTDTIYINGNPVSPNPNYPGNSTDNKGSNNAGKNDSILEYVLQQQQGISSSQVTINNGNNTPSGRSDTTRGK